MVGQLRAAQAVLDIGATITVAQLYKALRGYTWAEEGATLVTDVMTAAVVAAAAEAAAAAAEAAAAAAAASAAAAIAAAQVASSN